MGRRRHRRDDPRHVRRAGPRAAARRSRGARPLRRERLPRGLARPRPLPRAASTASPTPTCATSSATAATCSSASTSQSRRAWTSSWSPHRLCRAASGRRATTAPTASSHAAAPATGSTSGSSPRRSSPPGARRGSTTTVAQRCDSEATTGALEAYVRLLRDAGPPDSSRLLWTEAHDRFEAGEAAFFIDAVTELTLMHDAGGPHAEAIGVALVPYGLRGTRHSGLRLSRVRDSGGDPERRGRLGARQVPQPRPSRSAPTH